jgi:hypothetical protein
MIIWDQLRVFRAAATDYLALDKPLLLGTFGTDFSVADAARSAMHRTRILPAYLALDVVRCAKSRVADVAYRAVVKARRFKTYFAVCQVRIAQQVSTRTCPAFLECDGTGRASTPSPQAGVRAPGDIAIMLPAFVDNDSCPVDNFDKPARNMKAGLALDVI